MQHEQGVALCHYFETGVGEWVKQDRFAGTRYRDELVTMSAEILSQALAQMPVRPQWLTAVPSLRRPTLVPDFAKRLAEALKLPYHEALHHRQQHPPQDTMHNSFQQVNNVLKAYEMVVGFPRTPVLLVDDIADSRWTLTVLAHQMQTAGVRAVIPFVLATTGSG